MGEGVRGEEEKVEEEGEEEGERGNEPNENMNETRENEVPRASLLSERNRDPGGVVAGSRTAAAAGDEGVPQGWVSYGQGSGAAVVASTLPSLSVAPRFPGSADRQAG